MDTGLGRPALPRAAPGQPLELLDLPGVVRSPALFGESHAFVRCWSYASASKYDPVESNP